MEFTRFAPAEKVSPKDILAEYDALRNNSNLRDLLGALPYVAALINRERQIVFANDAILQMVGVEKIEEILGERPGKLLGCIHAEQEPGGCGTSEHCGACGAVLAILKSQKTGQKVADECRIATVSDGKIKNLDLLISITPLTLDSKPYWILTLNDISSEKRKRILEKLFFHDILNLSGSLQGFVELLENTKDPAEIKNLVDIARNITRKINEEILGQRELLAAENGDLVPLFSSFNTLDFLKELQESIGRHEVARDKQISIAGNSENIECYSDKALLARVMINMLKNALEESGPGEQVTLGVRSENENLVFWVWNASVISRNIQLQIFHRSFSTKGSDRGLGTYSMKMLSENYLKGKVWFTSETGKGTSFYVSIPREGPTK